MFQPSLALKFGVNEAIFIQKLHYLLNPEFNKNVKENSTWVYNTYSQWEEIFPFWGRNTIIRTIESCEKQGIVISKTLFKNKSNRTKWYTLSYQLLNSLDVGTYTQNGHSVLPKMGKRSTQNGQINHLPKMGKCTNKQNITQEITTKENHAREGVPKPKSIKPAKAEPSIDLTADSVCDEPVQEIPEEHPEPKAAAPRPAKTKTASQQEFELFWLAYVLKVGKGAAVKAFGSAMNKTSLEAILTALETQKLERAERERLGLWSPSWKHPSTWLNQECWNDVPKTADELQKEAEAKRIAQHPTGQKKPNYSDRVEAANRATGNIIEKFYPDLAKYFPAFAPEPKLTDFNIPQLRQEVVVNAI